MTVTTAINALKQGKRVQASCAKDSPFFYMMFQNDLIILMEQVTSCAAREVERLSEESFLERGDLSEFEEYETRPA